MIFDFVDEGFVFNSGIIHLIRQERDVFAVCLHPNILLFLALIYM